MISDDTLLNALVERLKDATVYNRADQIAPVAVLWTDKDRQWQDLIPTLRESSLLLTLGDYNPATRTGPAIWLRCMVARTLPDADWATNVTPILYLPGVSRQELRAVEDCLPALQPLAEMQYRGILWTQKSGRDWTISAFLQSADGGLSIPVASDAATREALVRALPKLARETLATFRVDAPLSATKINALLNPEPIKNLLQWMNDPDGRKAAMTAAEWEAFRANCQGQFGFNPDADGDVTSAEKLGARQGAWESVWNRFAEAPRRYPNLPELLRRARPTNPDGLLHEPASWPQDNEAAETALRKRLLGMGDLSLDDARQVFSELEAAHGMRRTWVWCELGQSALADTLPALTALAEATEAPVGGANPTEIAKGYAHGGWKADAAVLDALGGSAGGEDVAAIKAAVNALYRPWLEATAVRFQEIVEQHPLIRSKSDAPPPKMGHCILFADGLRYDVGHRLADALAAKGMSASLSWQFAALPTVTPTAKPAVSPVASRLAAGTDFGTVVVGEGTRVTIEVLRKELNKAGYAILLGDDTGSPTQGAAWTEAGSLDSHGHAEGWKLARRIPEQIQVLAERISTLLVAGWVEVKVITDHGWLLLPGGLPKADLPEHLTEARKGRCARLKPASVTPVQSVPWFWDALIPMAVAPGIGCFVAGKEYEHGGLSPQECVIPVLTVRASAPSAPPVSIREVKWAGLRCRVQLDGSSAGLQADLRSKAADATTSVALSAKPFNELGQVSLAVPEDDRQGEAAIVVALSASGQIVAQQATVIGED